MTVLTSENRLAGTTNVTLPRVNLLPPEIAEAKAFQKVQMGLGAALLATVAVVGVMYTSASASVGDAQTELDTANARGTALQADIAKYRNVTAIYAAAAAAETALTSAMGDEVRYSVMLDDLSLTVPDNVWLKSISYTAAAAGATGTSAAPAGLGTFTATATAFSHDDVAVWLESIAGLKTLTNPYFSNATEALLGTRKVVNYTSTATVTQDALSKRYQKVGG